MHCAAHPPLFVHPVIMQLRAEIMKLIIMQSAAFALLFHRTKYFSQHCLFSQTFFDVHKCQYEEEPVTSAGCFSGKWM
jgi:hypothetical protein